MKRARISVGPNLYYWRRADVEAFYDAESEGPIDVVYLGEVVCGKRHELSLGDWMAIARRLSAAGKEVVLSSLALPESETDLRLLRRLIDNGEFAIEANDMGAVRLASEARVPFVIGPHINAYNPAALALLRQWGAVRWVVPIDLSRDGLKDALAGAPEGLEVEVFAYGRLPLAFSARCFTARAHDRGKDDCGFACLDDPDGLLLKTTEDEPLLVLNGIQTQSARPYSLAGVIDEIAALGIEVLRLSPQSRHTFDVAREIRACLDGMLVPAAAAAAIDRLAGARASAGFWSGRPGMQ